jgi:hypothetical protein
MIEFRKPTCWVARHPNAGTYYDLIFKRSHIRKAATELRGMIKNAGRKLLGDSVVGAIDYYRKPQQKTSWDGPFNGQPARQELFKATGDRCEYPASSTRGNRDLFRHDHRIHGNDGIAGVYDRSRK